MKYKIKAYDPTLVNPRDPEAGNEIFGTIVYKPNAFILGDICVYDANNFFANLLYNHEETPPRLKESIMVHYSYEGEPKGDTIYTKAKTDELIHIYFKSSFVYLPVFAYVRGGVATVSTDPIISGYSPLDTFLSGYIYMSWCDVKWEFNHYYLACGETKKKLISEEMGDEIRGILKEEIRKFNAWLTGDMWYVEEYRDGEVCHVEDNFYSHKEAMKFAMGGIRE